MFIPALDVFLALSQEHIPAAACHDNLGLKANSINIYQDSITWNCAESRGYRVWLWSDGPGFKFIIHSVNQYCGALAL